jgi:Uma2 family endonuclease
MHAHITDLTDSKSRPSHLEAVFADLPIDSEQLSPLAKFLLLPEGAPYQLINGELIMTPAPVPVHQLIVMELAIAMTLFVRQHQCGNVLTAPIDVYLDNENILQPDILFISRDRDNIIGKKMIEAAPDLIVEVLSPQAVHFDLDEKYRVYEKAGVLEYWIVDPEKKKIDVFVSVDGQFARQTTSSGPEQVHSTVLSGFSVQTASIFP